MHAPNRVTRRYFLYRITITTVLCELRIVIVRGVSVVNVCIRVVCGPINTSYGRKT